MPSIADKPSLLAAHRDGGEPTNRHLLILLAIVAGLRLYLAWTVPIHEDEAYYWQWSRHLALSYYDHPPAIAWLIALGTHLGGAGTFGVRLSATLCSIASVWVIYRTAREWRGQRRDGLWAAVLAAVVPLFAVASWLATPDAPLALCWALGVWLSARALRDNRPRYWLLAGLALGLGMISKYSGVLLPVALLIALLLAPEGRRALRSRLPYLGMLLMVLPGLPVLGATLAADSHSLLYQLGHGFGAGERTPPWVTFGEFLAGQAVVVTPLLFGWLLWELAVRSRSLAGGVLPLQAGQAHSLLLLMPTLVTFGLFATASLFGDPEANWVGPAYVTGFVLLGARLAGALVGPPSARAFAAVSLMLPVALSSLLIADVLYPFIAARSGPSVQLRDRTEAAQWVQSLRDADTTPAALLAANHRLASFLAFSLPDRPETGVPERGGNARAYRLWRSPACDTHEAWYFTQRPLSPYSHAVRSVHKRARFDERRLGRVVGSLFAYRGIVVDGVCAARQ